MAHSAIIPVDIDKRYRWAIVEYAKLAELPAALTREFERVLESANSRPEGAAESIAELGGDLDGMIKRASVVITALAHFLDDGQNRCGLNFIKWLGASGWGNDIRLIKLFDAWSQEADKRKRAKRQGNSHVLVNQIAPASQRIQ